MEIARYKGIASVCGSQIPVRPASNCVHTLSFRGTQIFNAEGTHLVATVQAISAERRQSSDDTTLMLAEPENGQPDVLVRWFYPGELTGHEFVYSKAQEQELAQDKDVTFVGTQVMPSAEAAGE